jgi:hypothetical protein
MISHSITATDNESAVAYVQGGETLYIQVWGCDNSPWGGAGPSWNTYSLAFSMDPMTDDSFEENDSFGAAATLGAGYQGGLIVMPSDPDWFKVAVPAAGEVTVDCLFTERNDGRDDSDLELALYNADGVLLGISESPTDNESVTVTLGEAGDLYIKVWGCDNSYWSGHGPSWNSYALDVDVPPPVMTLCGAPPMPVSQAAGNTAPVIESMWTDAEVVVVPGSTQVSAHANDADGDALTYTWFKDPADDAVSIAGDGATVTVTITEAGTYTIGLVVSDGEALVEDAITVIAE